MGFQAAFRKTIKLISKIIFNKYLLVLVVFGVYITFFDEHSLMSRWESQRKMKEMQAEYNYYQEEIKKNKSQLQKLQTDDAYLEVFAREKYLMRQKGEVIFIIKE